MALDPMRMAQTITDSYFSYLRTTFFLRDASLREQFTAALQQADRFVKGPILEATPPFVTGASIQDLIAEGLLTPEFHRLGSLRLPVERSLYRHQEIAVRKLVGARRNLVVTTGTGSGKTETFLIPIFHHLLEQARRGQLRPGVQALLLYPMNALANDQVARLRELLENYPQITFGRYTGETEEKTTAARQRYRQIYGREPLDNEMLSRERMRATPPHILLTNYAMLEYLLLRPADNVFFDGAAASAWRFLVIDEAHTYTGAKGIEMALLLRRLKDRVVDGQAGRLQCIATSATIGSGAESMPAAADFAARLFGEAVEWDPEDESRQDVIRAWRLPLRGDHQPAWQPDPALYQKLRARLPDTEDDSAAVVDELYTTIQQTVTELPPWLAAARRSAGEDWRRFLHAVLRHSRHPHALQAELENAPGYVRELTKRVFGGANQDLHDLLTALVDLAVKARPHTAANSLLPARYHFFVRAIEGAFLQLRPRRQLFLERREQVETLDALYAVFEMATCRRCGAAYLVGEIVNGEAHVQRFLRHPSNRYVEEDRGVNYYLLLDDQTVIDVEDEDELEEDEWPNEQARQYRLCGKCGAIAHWHGTALPCACHPQNHVAVRFVPARDGKVTQCPACGGKSSTGLVWRFLTGNDATASVLATALYQQLPAQQSPALVTQTPQAVEDEWLMAPAATESHEPSARKGRQLLIFSDSRQAAAFFAPYLGRTYNQILRRRLILRTLEENAEHVVTDQWRVQDLIRPLMDLARSHGLLDATESPTEQRAEVWRWVLYELLAIDRRNSLEGLGCLGYELLKPTGWRAPDPLLRLGLTEDEVWQLYQILLDSLRYNGALEFPKESNVQPSDDFFVPRNRSVLVFERLPGGSRGRYRLLGWEPTQARTSNTRLDYLTRLLAKIGDAATMNALEILRGIWRSLQLADSKSPWRKQHFVNESLRDAGVGYRLHATQWLLRAKHVDPTVQWYRCTRCGNLTLFNVRGVCPTFRCDGQVLPCDPDTELAYNHYRALYTRTRPIIPLSVEEHTAQLTSEAAAELQTQFITGAVNVLSCSTTFELGVDVGELESVFMRNMPPSTANYLQRAGRAGRRTDSTAFALTFAQLRAHDLANYAAPMRMVSGEIAAPYFRLANAKIVRRHVYATALAAFWRTQKHTFGTVNDFFFQSDVDTLEKVREFLDQQPAYLATSLRRIVPSEMDEELGISNWQWVDGLLGNPDGVLTKAASRIRNDVAELETARHELIAAGRPSDYVLRVINTLQRTNILSYLSSQNVIPKYGFPVDVVSLQILHQSEEARRLELDRDLRIALSEYAPGSQIVAGGRLWTSRYLKRMPDRDWRRYRYAICDYCYRYQSVLADTKRTMTACEACKRPLTGRAAPRIFVIPEFGFIADTAAPGKPGDTPPERTHATRTYYSGASKQQTAVELRLARGRMIAVPAAEGKLAVVNRAAERGFRICYNCGYTITGNEKAPSPHPSPWGGTCRGTLYTADLGHEYASDILHLYFEGLPPQEQDFWLSLLYGLLEGASAALDIDRQDLDGCLYPHSGDPRQPALILFDDVPGGAGHVHRIAQTCATLRRVLEETLQRLSRCDCGGERRDTSCYGCLRNYRNQYYHEQLKRGPVIDFLRAALSI